MDFSLLTFSPPKRNSRIPKLGCKRRKSKSPITSPKSGQAVHKVDMAQKMTGNLRSRDVYSRCVHSKHPARGKENREKVTDSHFPNSLTSKLCPSIKNSCKKVIFNPCGRMNRSLSKKDLSSNSVILINEQSPTSCDIVNVSDASSEAKKVSGEVVASSARNISDSVVLVSDTSCSVGGGIQEANVKKKKSSADNSMNIVCESISSSVSEVKDGKARDRNEDLRSLEDLKTDSSNIVANTDSSDYSSNMKTPICFPVRRNYNLYCTEPRIKVHKTVNVSRQLDCVLVGHKGNVSLVNRQDGGQVNSTNNSKEGKCTTMKYQSENRKHKAKSKLANPYRTSLQNSFRKSVLQEVFVHGAKDGFDGTGEEQMASLRNKVLVDKNVRCGTSVNVMKNGIILPPKNEGGDDFLLSCGTKIESQEDHVPMAVSTPLSSVKFRDVENWLNNNDFSNVRENLIGNEVDDSFPKTDCASTTPSRADDLLSISTVEILNNVYGNDWRSADISKKCYTEPVQRHGLCKKSAGCPQMKCIKSNGQTKRSTSPSSDEEDLSEVLKRVYSAHKTNKTPSHQLLSTPDFIDDDSVEISPTLYLKIQSKDVKIDVKKTHRILQESCADTSSIADVENIVRQLHFSSSESGSSEKGVQTHTQKTSREVKNTKGIVKKPSKCKKPVEATAVIRKEANICTRRSSLHSQPSLSFLASLSAPTPKGKCDSEARFFKKNFTKMKESLGKKLFQLFNENIFENKLPHDMPLQWNVRMKQTAGYCYSKRTLTSTGEKIRTSRIVLSTKVIATPDRLRDTLIHEMCHAAAWILDMAKDGHGPHWKAWAKKATTVYPELPPIRRCHDYNIHTKFTYRCVGCGYSFGRHSKSLNLTVKRCGYCFGEFELLVNTKNKAGVVVQTPKLHRSPRGFARFVKDNYKTVKKEQPNLKHGDVMKLLSEQFKAKCQKSVS